MKHSTPTWSSATPRPRIPMASGPTASSSAGGESFPPFQTGSLLSRLNSLLRDLALQHCPSPPAAQVQVQSRLIMDKFSGDGSGDSGGRRKWEEDSRECY